LAKTLLDSLVGTGATPLAHGEPFAEEDGEEEETVRRERDAFVTLHPTLLAQYPGEYVAICQGVLVDHDKDGLALSLRGHERFADTLNGLASATEILE